MLNLNILKEKLKEIENKTKEDLEKLKAKALSYNEKKYIIEFKKNNYNFNKNKRYLVIFQGNNDSGTEYLMQCLKEHYKIFDKIIGQEEIKQEMENIKKSVYYQNEENINNVILKYFVFEYPKNNILITISPKKRYDEKLNFDLKKFINDMKSKIKIKTLGNYYPYNMSKNCNIDRNFVTKEKILMLVFELEKI